MKNMFVGIWCRTCTSKTMHHLLLRVLILVSIQTVYVLHVAIKYSHYLNLVLLGPTHDIKNRIFGCYYCWMFIADSMLDTNEIQPAFPLSHASSIFMMSNLTSRLRMCLQPLLVFRLLFAIFRCC